MHFSAAVLKMAWPVITVVSSREVLGDSAESPRYIETLPRRGYRYIGPVENFPTLQLVAETGDRMSSAGGSR